MIQKPDFSTVKRKRFYQKFYLKIRLINQNRYTAIIACFLISFKSSVLGDGLFSDIPSLSDKAHDSLIAHYNSTKGVNDKNGIVISWTPVDGNGSLLNDMILNSKQRGGGEENLITTDGSGKLIFDDTEITADGRYLEGTLSNKESTEFTVFWKGFYNSNAPFATSGTYAYNIGINNTSHQRDDGKGGFVVEQYNGKTYAGDDITPYDEKTTVWSTVLTANSHTFYANGKNLNVGGMPTYKIKSNASIIVGAYSSSGYDFIGEIEQLIIFETALSKADRKLVEKYLGSTDQDDGGNTEKEKPEISIKRNDGAVELSLSNKAHLLASYDLAEWFIIPETDSKVTISKNSDQIFYQAASEFGTIPSDIVLRTKIESDTWREVQFNVDTGELFFIGEQYHGFDHYTSHGNDLWWCYMNTTGKGSGLLEFLMDKNINAMPTKNKALKSGWTGYTSSIYSFLELKPLSSQKSLINHTAPETIGEADTTEAYTNDYKKVDGSKLFYTIYKNSDNGNIYLGVGGPSLNKITKSLPPGDGSSNRDNGVRADVAFKATILLSQDDKLELINKFNPKYPIYNDSSSAYYYEHPDGL